MLALVRELLRVERLHEDVDLLLEQLAIRLGVEHRAAERLHLAAVIPAADAEDHAPPGEDVGGREILGQPERMPHRRDVESAADAKPRREMSQMDGRHQDVRNALVALVLEVVLGQPEDAVPMLVHAPRDGLGLVEHRRQMLVRVASLVRGRGHLTHVPQIHVPGIHGRELADHVVPPLAKPSSRVFPASTGCRNSGGRAAGVAVGVARPRGTRPLLRGGWAPSGRATSAIAWRERVAQPLPPPPQPSRRNVGAGMTREPRA